MAFVSFEERRAAARAAVALPPGLEVEGLAKLVRPRWPALGDAAPRTKGEAAPLTCFLPEREGVVEDDGLLLRFLLVARRLASLEEVPLANRVDDLPDVVLVVEEGEGEEEDEEGEEEEEDARPHAVRKVLRRGVVVAAELGSAFSSAPALSSCSCSFLVARIRVTAIACEAVRSASSAMSSSKNWNACIIVLCLLLGSWIRKQQTYIVFRMGGGGRSSIN